MTGPRTISLLSAALAAVLAASLPSGAEAKTTYECRFKPAAANGDMLPDLVALAHEDGARTAIAGDGITQAVTGGPVEARVEADNGKRSTFTWKLRMSNARNQTTTMAYRLTVMKADLSATISATPMGYANSFQARGSCKRLKG